MKTFSMTDIGMVREVNQDNVYVSDTPIGQIPNLLVVADGMGGHNAGEVASAEVVNVLKNSDFSEAVIVSFLFEPPIFRLPQERPFLL